MNNDAFINSECLVTGIDYIKKNNKCGVWAPKLVGEDASFQVSCAELPSVKGLIQEYILLKNNSSYPNLNQWQKPHNVGNVIGAFMLMKREIIEEVGLLDEDYFFTVEDVDYCKRIHEAGYSIIYDPRCEITHIGGASQEDKWINDPYMHKSRILYFRKNHGEFIALLSKIIIYLGLNIRKCFSKYLKIKQKI